MKKYNFKKVCLNGLVVGMMIVSVACKGNSSDDVLPDSGLQKGESQMEDPGNVKVDPGDYKGIEVSVPAMHEVTDDEVEAQIKAMLQSASNDEIAANEIIKDGDVVSINFEKYYNDEPYGEAETNYYLTVGSGVFLDGEEKQLIGKCGGDVVTITMNYAGDYPVEDLAGKEIIYRISINGVVTETTGNAELTDEYVQTISECQTVDEFKKMIRSQMEESQKGQYDTMITQAIWEKLLDQVSIQNYPESLRDEKIEAYKAYDIQSAELENMDLESYVTSYLQMTMDEYEQQIATIVDGEIKYQMIVEKIADEEGLKIDHLTDQDWENYADQFGYGSVDEVKEIYTEEDLLYQMEIENVNEFLKNSAKVTESEDVIK